jgi:hypothetical protein
MALAGHRATIRQWAALSLGLIGGDGFIAHGYAKVRNGPERFAASLHACSGNQGRSHSINCERNTAAAYGR